MRQIIFVIALFALTPISFSTAEPLNDIKKMSVDETIAYALSTNPELVSSSYDVDLADENIDLAKTNYRPSVIATAQINHQQSNNDVDDEWRSGTSKTIGVTASQPLFRGGANANIDEQYALKKSAEKQFVSDIHDKILDIVSVYMETYRADQATMVNEDNVRLLGQELKATQARFDAGELTKTDVAQAEARLAQAEAELFREKAVYEVALANFRRETGYTDEVNVFYPDVDMSDLPSDLDAALSAGLLSHPDMIVAKTNIKAQEFDVEAQEGELYPDVTLDAAFDISYDPVQSNFDRRENASIGVTASLPLYQSGVLRNQIRQSQIRKSQLQSDMETVKRRVANDIIAAWERYNAIMVQLDAREAQVNASRLAYQGVKLEEEVGARSVLDVLDANQDVRDAELLLIDTKRDIVNAYYQLLDAMGRLDDSLWDKS